MKNNDGTYFIAITGGKKYPDRIEPFTWKGLEFFISNSYGTYTNIRDSGFQDDLYCATEKQSGYRFGQDFPSIKTAKQEALARLNYHGESLIRDVIQEALNQRKNPEPAERI